MRTLAFNWRSVFRGESVLVVFSIGLFLASLANATQWPVLRGFRFCGICVLLLSLTFDMLSSLEIVKAEQRRKRTILAAVLFLTATALCFGNGHFVITRSN